MYGEADCLLEDTGVLKIFLNGSGRIVIVFLLKLSWHTIEHNKNAPT